MKLREALNTYQEKVKEFYPGLRFGSSFSMYSGEEPQNCKYEFRFDAHNLIDTEYYVKRKTDLIHYTSSVQTLFEILNTGYIRLSNLIALNDPQESNFITKNLKMEFKESQIQDYKRNLFTASFCKVNDKHKPDEFNMWRLYGNDGAGAAIIFEVINNNKEWHNFLLGKVQYGECKAIEHFKNFIDFHNTFQEENSYPITNVPVVISSIMALHKSNIWKHEREVRLLSYKKYDQYTLKDEEPSICTLKHSISKYGINYAYLELPLFGGSEFNRLNKTFAELGYLSNFNELFPILRIKKVILGYRTSEETFNSVSDILQHTSEKYGSHIPVVLSHLREQMI